MSTPISLAVYIGYENSGLIKTIKEDLVKDYLYDPYLQLLNEISNEHIYPPLKKNLTNIRNNNSIIEQIGNTKLFHNRRIENGTIIVSYPFKENNNQETLILEEVTDKDFDYFN